MRDDPAKDRITKCRDIPGLYRKGRYILSSISQNWTTLFQKPSQSPSVRPHGLAPGPFHVLIKRQDLLSETSHFGGAAACTSARHFDHRSALIAIELFCQGPGPHVGHAHLFGGGGQRTGCINVSKQFNLTGTEHAITRIDPNSHPE